jgi:hypothetical protein
MNKKMDDADFDEIDRLIQCDVDEGLRAFRSGEFGKRLRARLAADEQAAAAKSVLRRIAVPAAAATLLAVFAALFFLNVHRSPAPGPVHPRIFAAALRHFPSFSRPPAAGSLPGQAGAAGMSEPGGGFRSALASAERWKMEEERATPPRPDGLRAPVLSLKKKMEILYRDRVIERALALLIGKSKEA